MTGGTAVPQPPDGTGTEDVAAGLARIEGYLMCRAALHTAREEGEAFAAGLTWLTTAQHEEVARRFAEAHVEVTRTALRSVVARCEELKEEYTARYEQLRRRLLCTTAVLLVSAAILCLAALLGTGTTR
ncbi:hypothetical protein IHE55_03750 [Streptomyces pactum]|uniref:Cytochrome C oxidase subunit I n=1 Tax=Streptomyces pactum TaxID=68249 RepID=A0ABS0NFN1_9ACTN|nr:hypothetical protein [Streptomyces pactum]MBH5333962.1 hypothetical protein [Streptomyces pactum]